MVNSFAKTKEQADLVDEKIKGLIMARKHFIVEAAAGSGKTYSLNNIVSWLEKEKPLDFGYPGKKIACITFTNVAVEVMKSRLLPDSNVEPCTIHSFCWKLIKPFQDFMINHVNEAIHSKKIDCSNLDICKIDYDLGVRYFDNETDTLFLYHDDVIKFFSLLLDNKKFRKVMASIYPIILIDEYQDSNKLFMEKMILYFLNNQSKPFPILGLFGDSWQSIYSGLSGIGEIKNENFSIIHKNTNFRSESNIVKMLNRIRPDNQQSCAKEDEPSKGNVYFLNCSKGSYNRYLEGQKINDLKPEDLKYVLNQLSDKIERMTNKKPKILMITHSVISKNLGFEKLIETLGTDVFRDQPDPFFEYCRKIIEPMYKALNQNDISHLADVLGVERTIIRTKKDKTNWKNILHSLQALREKNLDDVLKYCLENTYGLIPKSDEVEALIEEYKINSELTYNKKVVKDVLDIPYKEFLSAFEYIDSDTMFSTEHGSKGEEFENVIFVINKGWNLYQYHKYAPFDKSSDDPSFIRNRNLFYVCSSRAIKNLFFLLTYNGGDEFNNYLRYLSDEKEFDFDAFIHI